jgi:two-component system OmpR family sensor kinase
MRRPLFLKIFVGVSLSFFVVIYFVWVMDAILQTNPSRTAERISGVGLAGATSAINLGGEPALRKLLNHWPAFERAHFSYRRLDATSTLRPDLVHSVFADVVTDPAGNRWGIAYSVARFDNLVTPPFVFDMGPRILAGSFLGILIFSLALALYLIVPISRIRQAFGRLAAGDLKVRLGPNWLRRRDEIADLAADFNKMATRLEELVAARDRLLADISHELRSPLARLHLAIALTRQAPENINQSLERICREADKLDEMVGELLTLSKLENGAKTSDEYFFLSEIVELVVNDARFEAQEKGVEINLVIESKSCGTEALVVGSGKLISRAIENIVRNALRFSRRGASITIELESSDEGTILYIRDQGPGVKPEQLTFLFDPFVQLHSPGSQGYGLGLSIAKRAVLAHGGSIEAANGLEEGLTITVWLPAAPNTSQSEHGRSALTQSASPMPV